MRLIENATVRQGKYRLLSRIGQGGQAEVWEAEQTGIDGFSRKVVLKCLLQEDTGNRERQRRSLLQEARLVAQLKHPNIVEIYEVGEEEGLVYIVMERIDGKDLEWLLSRCYRCFEQPLPWGLVAALGIEICKALHYAHQFKTLEGRLSPVIHRDLKPSNVLLSGAGYVKVIDFGIAKSEIQQDSDLKTLQGHIKGTPAYMSPEQLTSKPLDPRSDLFSLGSLLYELAAGELPFPGEDVMQIAIGVVTTEPKPLDLLRPEIPRDFDLLVRSLLAKAPEQRLANARLLQKELDLLLRRQEIYIDQEKLIRFYEGLRKSVPGTGEHMTFDPMQPSNPSLLALSVEASFLASMAKAKALTGLSSLQRDPMRETPLPSRPSPMGNEADKEMHDTEEKGFPSDLDFGSSKETPQEAKKNLSNGGSKRSSQMERAAPPKRTPPLRSRPWLFYGFGVLVFLILLFFLLKLLSIF